MYLLCVRKQKWNTKTRQTKNLILCILGLSVSEEPPLHRVTTGPPSTDHQRGHSLQPPSTPALPRRYLPAQPKNSPGGQFKSLWESKRSRIFGSKILEDCVRGFCNLAQRGLVKMCISVRAGTITCLYDDNRQCPHPHMLIQLSGGWRGIECSY